MTKAHRLALLVSRILDPPRHIPALRPFVSNAMQTGSVKTRRKAGARSRGLSADPQDPLGTHRRASTAHEYEAQRRRSDIQVQPPSASSPGAGSAAAAAATAAAASAASMNAADAEVPLPAHIIKGGEAIVTHAPAMNGNGAAAGSAALEHQSSSEKLLTLSKGDNSKHPVVDKARRTMTANREDLKQARVNTTATLKRMKATFEQRHGLELKEGEVEPGKKDGVRRRRAATTDAAGQRRTRKVVDPLSPTGQPTIAARSDEEIAAAKKARERAGTHTSRGRAATLKKMKLAAQLAELDGLMVVPAPHTLRSPVTTVYSRHQDFYPDDNKRYYMPLQSTARRMCVVIPCYNEPCSALKRTLKT